MALSLVGASGADPISRHDRTTKEEEVAIISRRLGLDIRADIELAWIVEEYQTAALPPGWKVMEGGHGATFYENALSRVRSVDNPIEPRFRELVKHFKSQKHQGLPADEITVLELLEPIERPADVADMADWMGISRELEPHLMWIAKLAVLESLPEGWEEGVDDGGKPIFRQTGTDGAVTYDHPGDAAFQVLLQRERRKRVPYLSIQQCVFDTPMVHFRNEFLEDGTELRIQVLPNSGEWMDFYDAYGERYWYHLGKNKVTTDINVVRRVPAAETIQRVWRGHLWRRVLHRMHAAALRIGGFWRLRHFQRGLARTRAARETAATRLQRFWLAKKACVLASHSVFLKLTEIGQRSRLAMRRRLLTAGLQSTGRTFATVRRATLRIQQSFRDHQVRQLLFDPRGHKTRAAQFIQRGMRRFKEMVRRKAQLELERRALLARQLSAVRVIQHAWRDFKVRRRYVASMAQFAAEHEQRKRAHRQQQLSRLSSGHKPELPMAPLAGATHTEDVDAELSCDNVLLDTDEVDITSPPPPPPGVAAPPPQVGEAAADAEHTTTSEANSRSSSGTSSRASLHSNAAEPAEPTAPPQAARPRDMSSMIRPVSRDAPRPSSALGTTNASALEPEASPEGTAMDAVGNADSPPLGDNSRTLTASASAAPQAPVREPADTDTIGIRTVLLEAGSNRSADDASSPLGTTSLTPATKPQISINDKQAKAFFGAHSETIGHDHVGARSENFLISAVDHPPTAPRLALQPEGWGGGDMDEDSDEDRDTLDLMRMELEPLIEEDEEEAAMEEAAMEEAALLPQRSSARARGRATTAKAKAPPPPSNSLRQRPTSAVLSNRSPYAKSSMNPRPASAAGSVVGTSKEDAPRSLPAGASVPSLPPESTTIPLDREPDSGFFAGEEPTPSNSHQDQQELLSAGRVAYDPTPPARASRPASAKPQSSASTSTSQTGEGASVLREGVREAWGRPESAKTMELRAAALQVEKFAQGSRGRAEYAPNVGVEVVVHTGDTPARTPAPSVGTTPRVRSAVASARPPSGKAVAGTLSASQVDAAREPADPNRPRPASAVTEKTPKSATLKGKARPSSAAVTRAGAAKAGHASSRTTGKSVPTKTKKASKGSAPESSVLEATLAKVSAAAEMLGRSRPSHNGGSLRATAEPQVQPSPPQSITHPPTDPTIDMLRSALRGTSSLGEARPTGEGAWAPTQTTTFQQQGGVRSTSSGAGLPSISKLDRNQNGNPPGQRRGSKATAMSGYNMARDPLGNALQTATESRRRSGRDAFGAPGEDDIQRLLKATLLGTTEPAVAVAQQRKNSTTNKQIRRGVR